MPVFTAELLRAPTIHTFPQEPEGESVVPYLMIPATVRRPFEATLWTSAVYSPYLRVAIDQVVYYLGRLFTPPVARHLISFVGPDATVFIFRRNHRLAPFRNVFVSDRTFGDVYITAIISWNRIMSVVIMNHFLAYGAPRNGMTLSEMLSDLEDHFEDNGYNIAVTKLGRAIVFVPRP